MKTNNNAFDKIMEDYNLDHVIINEGIDSEVIKNNAFEQLGLGGRKKKRFSKKAMISLIAAAVVAAVVGTSVIAAGQFKNVFDGYIIGDDDTPVYTGDNVKINSSKTDVTIQGITCDDTFLFAALEIKKKDGTPFVDSLDDTYILPYDYRALIDRVWPECYDDQHVFFQELMPDEDDEDYEWFMTDRTGEIKYDFADTKTIKGMVSYDNSSRYTRYDRDNPEEYGRYDFQGKTLELREGKIYIYHKDEVIYRYKEVNNWADFDYDIYEKQTEKIKEKYTPLLKENQMIMYDQECKMVTNDEWYHDDVLYIATVTPVDVDFVVTFDINYQPQKLVVDVDKDKTYQIGNMNMHFDSIEVYPFSIYMDIRYEGKLDMDVFNGDSDKKPYGHFGLDIEMNDGKMIKTGLGMSLNGGGNTVEVGYRQFTDEDGNLVQINTDNIKAIYLGGVKIYG